MPSPSCGPGDSPGLQEPPTHPAEGHLARGKVWNPRASRGPRLQARGRFLKFPIQNGGKETASPRRSLQAHAPTHINVGGYMRGERKRREKGKSGAAVQGITAAFTGLWCPVALHWSTVTPGPAGNCRTCSPCKARGLLGLSGHPRARDCSIISPAANARIPRSPRELTRVLR